MVISFKCFSAILLLLGSVQADDVSASPAAVAAPVSETPAPVSASSAPTVTTVPAVTSVSVPAKAEVAKVTRDEISDEGWEYENKTAVDTRRILYGKDTELGKRPYMVYLQLTKESAKLHKYRGWLCGGVIVDRYYVLTSAACVEDADKFYVVSGTNKFVDSFDYKSDECVCKHRRRVVWKCIPKNYKFDFKDTIKWSSNDIAIIKVDKAFKLGVTEKGCQFAPDIICYNNISRELEKPGTKGWIVGWGSRGSFREGVYRRQDEPKVHIPQNSKCLQEAKVCVMDNEVCAKRWAEKFRSIITQYMICTKDVPKLLSEICDKKYANCTDIDLRRAAADDTSIESIDLGRHLRYPDDYAARRAQQTGGFCENDHGGPLIVKYQGKERVIGVISACKIEPKSHNCHGPFLYTSIFKNRQFIQCAINKDIEESCRRVFRTGITHEEWDVSWDGVVDDRDFEGEKADVSEASGEAKKRADDKEETKPARRRRGISQDPMRRASEVFYESSKDENVNEPDEE